MFPMFDSVQILKILRKFIVFGGGSLVGAALDYTVTLFLHDVFSVEPSGALALSMTISASVVFLYHEKFTFGVAGAGRMRRYARFLLLAILVLALRVALLESLLAGGLSPPLALAMAIVFASLVNFAASSLFVFLKGSE